MSNLLHINLKNAPNALLREQLAKLREAMPHKTLAMIIREAVELYYKKQMKG